MENTITQKSALLIAVIVVLFAMKEASSIIAPTLLAAFIATIFSGAITRLQRIGVPFALAATLIVIILLLVVLFISTVIGESVSSFRANASGYQANLIQKFTTLAPLASVIGITPDEVTAVLHGMNPSNVTGILINLLQSVTDLFGSGFTLLLTVIFMLIDAGRLSRTVHTGMSGTFVKQLGVVIAKVRHYLSIKLFTSCITGALVTLLLLWFGVDLPFLWGFVALLLNFIPNIGSILAALPAVLLAWVQFDLLVVLWVVLGFVVINLVIGSVLEPKMMNNTLGISLLAVFLSLLFWGWVFGLIGMFLSVPLTMTIKIYLEQYQQTRFFAALL